MKPFTKNKAFFISSLFAFILYGCVKNDDFSFDKMAAGQWTPEFAIPLIHSNLSIRDITDMNDTGMFSVNSNHQISLIYNTNIYSISGYEFFTPVNQSDFQSFQMGPADSILLSLNDTVTITQNRVVALSFPNGEQIDSLTFRKGMLRIDLGSSLPHNGILNISIPTATINGVPFSKNIPISAATTSTVYTQNSFDMSGYNMATKNAGMPNQLLVKFALTLTKTDTVSNSLNKNFDITTAFDSITPASLFGFLGQREFNIPADSSEISMFSNFQNGGIHFEDPIMTISLSNSFGMPIDAQIGTLSAILGNGTVMPITGPIPSPLIDYPIILGQAATNSFVFDKTNSNIQQVVDAVPKYLLYNITAGTNTPLPTYNFMSDSSKFSADMRIEFPLSGYASGFTIQDTVDFGIGDISELTSVAFRLNISNGFPVHSYTQLYFTDDNYNILDSLFTNSQDRIIAAAEIDANGKVIQPTVRSADELFEGTKLQHLFTAKKILIKGILETADAPTASVKFYDDYKLDFKLGVRTKLRIDF